MKRTIALALVCALLIEAQAPLWAAGKTQGPKTGPVVQPAAAPAAPQAPPVLSLPPSALPSPTQVDLAKAPALAAPALPSAGSAPQDAAVLPAGFPSRSPEEIRRLAKILNLDPEKMSLAFDSAAKRAAEAPTSETFGFFVTRGIMAASPETWADAVVERAYIRGITRAQIGGIFTRAMTRKELIREFFNFCLLNDVMDKDEVMAMADGAGLRRFFAHVWREVALESPSPLSRRDAGWPVAAEVVEKDGVTFNLHGIMHGRDGGMTQGPVRELVRLLAEQGRPLVSEQKFPLVYGYAHGVETLDHFVLFPGEEAPVRAAKKGHVRVSQRLAVAAIAAAVPLFTAFAGDGPASYHGVVGGVLVLAAWWLRDMIGIYVGLLPFLIRFVLLSGAPNARGDSIKELSFVRDVLAARWHGDVSLIRRLIMPMPLKLQMEDDSQTESVFARSQAMARAAVESAAASGAKAVHVLCGYGHVEEIAWSLMQGVTARTQADGRRAPAALNNAYWPRKELIRELGFDPERMDGDLLSDKDQMSSARVIRGKPRAVAADPMRAAVVKVADRERVENELFIRNVVARFPRFGEEFDVPRAAGYASAMQRRLGVMAMENMEGRYAGELSIREKRALAVLSYAFGLSDVNEKGFLRRTGGKAVAFDFEWAFTRLRENMRPGALSFPSLHVSGHYFNDPQDYLPAFRSWREDIEDSRVQNELIGMMLRSGMTPRRTSRNMDVLKTNAGLMEKLILADIEDANRRFREACAGAGLDAAQTEALSRMNRAIHTDGAAAEVRDAVRWFNARYSRFSPMWRSWRARTVSLGEVELADFLASRSALTLEIRAQALQEGISREALDALAEFP